MALAAEASVVKVIAEYQSPNVSRPWLRGERSAGSGSGFCVTLNLATSSSSSSPSSNSASKGKESKEGAGEKPRSPKLGPKTERGRKYIVTNAHCVLDSVKLYLHKPGVAQDVPAKVVYLVEECDLAILESSEEFMRGLKPLKLGQMPPKLSEIFVLGYPLGGINMSLTRGQVNRIQLVPYLGIVYGVAIQVDAPINFGNSGGPAVNKAGQVVGVAFYGEDDSKTQNMGYLIPPMILNYVLRKFEAGLPHRGLGDLALETQVINNPALRKRCNLKPNEPGVLVTSSQVPEIEAGDVLMSINGITVESDGMVLLSELCEGAPNNEVVPWKSLVGILNEGETLKLEIQRKGKTQKLSTPVTRQHWGVPYFGYQAPHDYYMVGGIVFCTFTWPRYLELKQAGENVAHLAPLMYDLRRDEQQEQFVIITELLETPLLEGYQGACHLVRSFNGQGFKSLAQLHQLVSAQLAKKSGYLEFEVEKASRIHFVTLEVSEVIAQQAQIMADHGIRQEYS